MAFIRKIKAGLVKQESTDFVGEDGNIFFDIDTGEFRISDGVTPGGLPLTGGTGGSSTVISAPFAVWAAGSITLLEGQLGYDETNDELKVGDGSSAWLDLDAISTQGAVEWSSTNW